MDKGTKHIEHVHKQNAIPAKPPRFYAIPVSPAWLKQTLKAISPKAAYRHRRHRERWEKRYQKAYPIVEGQIGTFGGVTIIE